MEENTSIKCALNECNRSWHLYLHMLNDLCGAGSQLAHSLTVLEMCTQQPIKENSIALQNHPTMLLKNSWANLTRATREATIIVKANIESLLQEMVVFGNLEGARNENALIIMENAQTLLKVQQEFCSTSRRAFSALTCCLACQVPIGKAHITNCSMLDKANLLQQKKSDIWRDRVWGGENSPFPSGFNLDPEPQLCLETDTAKHLKSLRAIFEQSNCLAPTRRQSLPAALIIDSFAHLMKSPKGNIMLMPHIWKSVQYASKPFYREVITSVDFPPFPLNTQETYIDCEKQQFSDGRSKQPVSWNQTQMMPKINNYENSNTENNAVNISDHGDGLLNALKLLSISRNN